MVCPLKEQLVMLGGGVILKLEKFEGATSEKRGGGGGGVQCFFAEKIH